MNDRHTELRQRLDALRHNFEAELHNRVEAIAQAWRQASTIGESGSQMSALRSQVHHLAGTSGIFGLHEVGRAALQLEEALDRRSAAGPGTPIAAGRHAIDHLVEALQACTCRARPNAHVEP